MPYEKYLEVFGNRSQKGWVDRMSVKPLNDTVFSGITNSNSGIGPDSDRFGTVCLSGRTWLVKY